MSKPKYQKPVLSSIGLPIKRAQGFEVESYCAQGNSAGGTGGECNNGWAPKEDTVLGPSACDVGNTNFVYDGCVSGYTIYTSGAVCDSGSNVT